MIAVKEPCPQCPFSRSVAPGALGGTKPEAYIGQAAGPFTLPCHMHCDFDDPEWRDKAMVTPQCAGAASFRTHMLSAGCVPGKYPEGIPLLPANPQVFSSAAEFMAHHARIPVSTAKILFSAEKIRALAIEQLVRAYKGMKP